MYCNAKKFSEISGLSYETVMRLIKDGKIPAYKPYRRWMIPIEEALEAIKQTPMIKIVKCENFLSDLKKI